MGFFQHVVREKELMLYLIWFHWMRRCDGACLGAAGKLQGRGRRQVGGTRLKQYGSCTGEGLGLGLGFGGVMLGTEPPRFGANDRIKDRVSINMSTRASASAAIVVQLRLLFVRAGQEGVLGAGLGCGHTLMGSRWVWPSPAAPGFRLCTHGAVVSQPGGGRVRVSRAGLGLAGLGLARLGLAGTVP